MRFLSPFSCLPEGEYEYEIQTGAHVILLTLIETVTSCGLRVAGKLSCFGSDFKSLKADALLSGHSRYCPALTRNSKPATRNAYIPPVPRRIPGTRIEVTICCEDAIRRFYA